MNSFWGCCYCCCRFGLWFFVMMMNSETLIFVVAMLLLMVMNSETYCPFYFTSGPLLFLWGRLMMKLLWKCLLLSSFFFLSECWLLMIFQWWTLFWGLLLLFWCLVFDDGPCFWGCLVVLLVFVEFGLNCSSYRLVMFLDMFEGLFGKAGLCSFRQAWIFGLIQAGLSLLGMAGCWVLVCGFEAGLRLACLVRKAGYWVLVCGFASLITCRSEFVC